MAHPGSLEDSLQMFSMDRAPFSSAFCTMGLPSFLVLQRLVPPPASHRSRENRGKEAIGEQWHLQEESDFPNEEGGTRSSI